VASGSHNTIAVTGATGFVGRHIAAALVASGCRVRALIRSAAKADRTLPRDAAIDRVEGDVLDARVLADLIEGADAVVHTVGIRREVRPEVTFERAHTMATARVVDGARHAGVRRFIQISALGTRANAPTAYFRTKFDAETIVRRSSLDWTILRPSIIHGPDGEFVGMVRDWVLGRAAPRFFLPYFARLELTDGFPPRPKLVPAMSQPVHVDDVALAVVRSLERPETVGEVIPLVGPEPVDWPTMLTTFRDAMPMGNRRMKTIPIPAPVAVNMARLAGILGMANALPFGEGEPVMGAEDNTANTARARALLGIDPVGFADGVRAYAGAL
jgi:NADH dehydrogenase